MKVNYSIIEQREFHSGEFALLKKAMEDTLNCLAEELRQDIDGFLETILDLKRCYSISNNETIYYVFLITLGGPNIYLRTDGVMEGAWCGDSLTIQITDERILEILEEIQERLDEIYAR